MNIGGRPNYWYIPLRPYADDTETVVWEFEDGSSFIHDVHGRYENMAVCLRHRNPIRAVYHHDCAGDCNESVIVFERNKNEQA